LHLGLARVLFHTHKEGAGEGEREVRDAQPRGLVEPAAMEDSRVRTPIDRPIFETFLHALAPDHEEAGRTYEATRACLLRFFDTCQCFPADELADETLDRIARRIFEGVDVTDLRRYALGVARRVASEHRKMVRFASSLPALLAQPVPYEEDHLTAQLDALERGLARLPGTERDLVLSYFRQEGAPRSRRQLSQEAGLSRVALRVRVHRIRKKLAVMLADCVG
jgi:DNA-directed RNA polymerase specialized sigma24 family protein